MGTMSAASSSRQNWHRRIPSPEALRSRVFLATGGSSVSITMVAPVLAGSTSPTSFCVFNHCVNGTSSAARIDEWCLGFPDASRDAWNCALYSLSL